MKYYLCLVNFMGMLNASEVTRAVWTPTFHNEPEQVEEVLRFLKKEQVSGALIDLSDRLIYHLRLPHQSIKEVVKADAEKIQRARSVCEQQFGKENNSCQLIGKIFGQLNMISKQLEKENK